MFEELCRDQHQERNYVVSSKEHYYQMKIIQNEIPGNIYLLDKNMYILNKNLSSDALDED